MQNEQVLQLAQRTLEDDSEEDHDDDSEGPGGTSVFSSSR